MADDVRAELQHKRTKAVHIDVDTEGLHSVKATLEASIKAELRTPKDEDDRSFLLVSTFEIVSTSRPELFRATIVADFYFETDMLVTVYDDIIHKQCLPIIKKEFEAMSSAILADMGYKDFLRTFDTAE